MSYLFLVLFLADFAVVSLWLVYGRKPKLNSVVEFYPPDDINPAELGYIYDGVVNNRDVIALIFYWADKGYIAIDNSKENDIVLTKLKDLPSSAKSYETLLFEDIFEKESLGIAIVDSSFTFEEKSIIGIKEKDSVKLNDWKYGRANTNDMRRIKGHIRSYVDVKDKFYDWDSMKAQKISRLVLFIQFIICYIILRIISPVDNGDYIFMFSFVYVIFTVFTIAPLSEFDGIAKKLKSPSKKKRQDGTGELMFIVIGVWGMFFICTLFSNSLLIGFAIGISTIIIALFSINMKKIAYDNIKLKERIIGFRSFIEYAEKDRIELLVSENPEYYYNILPYAYVLGVTEKWAKKFEDFDLASYIQYCKNVIKR